MHRIQTLRRGGALVRVQWVCAARSRRTNSRNHSSSWFNPETSLDRVETTDEQRVEAEESGDQQNLASTNGLAQVEQVSDDVREFVEQFEDREQQLRERFEAVVD